MGKKPMGVIQTRLTTIDMEENKIEIYRSADGKVELNVKLEKDTVWLTQNQMAELFGVDRTSIVRHIRNIYKVEELDEISTCAKNAQVRFEGSRKNIIQIFRVVWRRIKHHLVMILQHITKRSQPQGTQHPFRHIIISDRITLQIIPIAVALVAFHSNAKLRLDILTITMKGTFVQLILILISVGITPLISNLLKGKMLTIQEAYQPTIEFYTIVHNL